MSSFTLDSTLDQIIMTPELSEYQPYLLYSNPATRAQYDEGQRQLRFAPIAAFEQNGWSAEGIVNGLNFLVERIRAGKTKLIALYPASEIAENEQQKAMVNLYRIMPDQLSVEKESIVIAAGGAYTSVCSIAEAIPTARHFVEAGHQVFVLTYRVAELEAAIHALDDIARAEAYLVAHQEELAVDPKKLVFCGFSAGANLISNWGSPVIGYKAYGLPKPKAMFPIYT